MAIRLSHDPQLRQRALNSRFHGLEPAASIHSSLAASSTQSQCTRWHNKEKEMQQKDIINRVVNKHHLLAY